MVTEYLLAFDALHLDHDFHHEMAKAVEATFPDVDWELDAPDHEWTVKFRGSHDLLEEISQWLYERYLDCEREWHSD